VDTSSSSNNYLTNTKGDILITDKPVYYVTIADLPLLPSAALDALTRLSFSTEDGSLHNYVVKGVHVAPESNTNSAYSLVIDFTSSKKLVVSNHEAVFIEVLQSRSTVSLVVNNNQALVAQRRLQLMQGLRSGSADSGGISDRCSLDSGVCYHTFEEMMHLNDIDGEGAVDGERRLLGSAANYVEISNTFIGMNPVNGAVVTTGASVYMHGGPVILGPVNVYLIWYGQWSNNDVTQVIVKHFISNLGGSSYWNAITTYYDLSGTRCSPNLILKNDITVTSTADINTPSNSVASIVLNAISGGKLPRDPSGVYLVIPSDSINDAANQDCGQYCGYHTISTTASDTDPITLQNSVVFGLITNPNRCPSQSSCMSSYLTTTTGSPNNNAAADAMVSVIAHELSEAITNPLGTAWYNGMAGDTGTQNENGDQCGFNFGSLLTSNSNIMLGGKNYLLQQIWSNAVSQCVMSSPLYSKAAPQVMFSATGAVQSFAVPAGVTSITVTAAGASGAGSKSPRIGGGGQITSTIPVTPLTTYYIFVGINGASSTNAGWNGGGYGYAYSASTSCASYTAPVSSITTLPFTGGGATDIRTTSGYTDYTNVLVVAAGAGGGVPYSSAAGGNGDSGDVKQLTNYYGAGTSGACCGVAGCASGGGGGGRRGGLGGTKSTAGSGVFKNISPGAGGLSWSAFSTSQVLYRAQGTNFGNGWLQIVFTCPAGYFCPDVLTNIQPCPSGSYCPAGSTAALPCAPGFYCPSPSTIFQCTAVGAYCPGGSTATGLCPSGYYCPGPDTALQCPSGVSCPVGTTSCASCPTLAPTPRVSTGLAEVPSKKPVAAVKPPPSPPSN